MTCVSSPLSLRCREIPEARLAVSTIVSAARVPGAFDRGVCGEQPRESGLRLGAQRPIGGEQRLGAVCVGGQEQHREPGPLRETQRRRGQLVRAVQDHRRDGRVTRAAQGEVEPVAGCLRRGP